MDRMTILVQLTLATTVICVGIYTVIDFWEWR